MPTGNLLHSLFGASKVAAGVLVQEYGRYFGMRAACFRGGCITSLGHSGGAAARLPGLPRQVRRPDTACTVPGHKGGQVRDNIHCSALVPAIWRFSQRPTAGAASDIGGGRHASCSMREGVAVAESPTGRPMRHGHKDEARVGDHVRWIGDVGRFRSAVPEWSCGCGLHRMTAGIHAGQVDRPKRGSA